MYFPSASGSGTGLCGGFLGLRAAAETAPAKTKQENFMVGPVLIPKPWGSCEGWVRKSGGETRGRDTYTQGGQEARARRRGK